jgi:hypothetical protein
MSQHPLTQEMQADLAIVDFSMEVQAFLKTRIGKYLLDRAADESTRKLIALKVHDIAADPAGAIKLQGEIWRAESFVFWLTEAINAGTELMKQMLAEERQALGQDGTEQPGGDSTGN